MSNPLDSEKIESGRRRSSGRLRVAGDEAASVVRRLCAVLVAAWLGAAMMLVLVAPAAFRSVDSALQVSPPAFIKALKLLGENTLREVLRYQVGEANRLMFESWGMVQLILSGVLCFLLLFFTTVRKTILGISAGMLVLSLAIHFLLIPRIVETGRVMYSAQGAEAARQQFGALHVAFSTFEAAVAGLGILLLVLLLRRKGGRGSRRGGGRSDSGDDFRE